MNVWYHCVSSSRAACFAFRDVAIFFVLVAVPHCKGNEACIARE